MEFAKVRSSTISAVGYDEATKVLGVKFRNGSEYHYLGVPKALFEALMSASSAGNYLNKYIKDTGYQFRRVK